MRSRDVPHLVGSTVALRPLTETDVPRIVEACADERTQHWLGTLPSPYSTADALGWIGRSRQGAEEGSKLTWAVADPRTDALLGAANLGTVIRTGPADAARYDVTAQEHAAARG